MGERRHLPDRREGETREVIVAGQTFFYRTGEYEDGTLGEIFIDVAKEGTFLRASLNAFSISMSLGLQYGVPLEEYVEAFRGMKFAPSGIVHGHEDITEADSFLDLMMRDLAARYLKYSPHDKGDGPEDLV